jgi:hypothetical protein
MNGDAYYCGTLLDEWRTGLPKSRHDVHVCIHKQLEVLSKNYKDKASSVRKTFKIETQ